MKPSRLLFPPPLLAVVFACALLALASCPGLPTTLEKPTAELKGVAITSVSLTGLDARLSFALTNPNSIGLPLRAIDWEFSIGGAAPVRGRATLSETIPAKGSAPVDVDLHISPASALQMSTRIAAGANDYHVAGTMHFTTSLGDVALLFDHRGALSSLP